MSIYNKMVKAIDDCNLDDYLELLTLLTTFL